MSMGIVSICVEFGPAFLQFRFLNSKETHLKGAELVIPLTSLMDCRVSQFLKEEPMDANYLERIIIPDSLHKDVQPNRGSKRIKGKGRKGTRNEITKILR